MKKLCRYAALSSLAAAMLMSTGCTSTTDDGIIFHDPADTVADDTAAPPSSCARDAAAIDATACHDAVRAHVPSISGGFHFPRRYAGSSADRIQGIPRRNRLLLPALRSA